MGAGSLLAGTVAAGVAAALFAGSAAGAAGALGWVVVAAVVLAVPCAARAFKKRGTVIPAAASTPRANTAPSVIHNPR